MRRPESSIRRSSLRGTAAVAFAAAILVVSLPAIAEARCFRVAGSFSSEMVPPPVCQSPVGVCTEGSLRGLLRGDYSFTAQSFQSTGDPSIPMVSFYTGTSEIRTRWGTLVLTDAGSQTYEEGGEGPMAALLTVVEGTGWFRGISGYLQVFGTADYGTGLAEGRYVGKLCY